MLKKVAQTTKNTITKSGKKTTSFLEDNILVVRLLCIALLLCVKFSPDYILDSLDIIWVRVVIAGVVILLLYADILSASMFTLAYIVGIQESRSRKSVNALLNKFTDLVAEEEDTIDTNNTSRYGNGNGNGYGNYKDILARKSDEDNLNYENQIGQFDITPDLNNMKGDNFRINMGQSSEKIGSVQTYNSTNAIKHANDSFTDISKDTELLVFRNDMNQRQQELNTSYGLAEKDCIIDKVYGIQHPASKTISQNVEDDKTEYNRINAFTNEQHLNDIQVNTAQGSDVEVPCGIEVMKGMWNTQGLQPSPITGFDTSACNSSKVILKPTS